MQQSPTISVIIKTHNDERTIHQTMEYLLAQTVSPNQIILMDSASRNPSYLERYRSLSNLILLVSEKDLGFCRGNNFAYEQVPASYDYVLFLNPDAFLVKDFIEKSLAWMEQDSHKLYGAVSGMTLGYCFEEQQPNGRYDSTGIFRTWYGRWYDRAQGERVSPQLYQQEENVPALCAAVIFCRKKALDQILLRGREVFDETFFMYKDDIDLSIRLQRKQWKLAYCPQLIAYHCRGWNPDRSKMPRKFRLMSARNELWIHWQMRSLPGICYSFAKYLVVKCWNA